MPGGGTEKQLQIGIYGEDRTPASDLLPTRYDRIVEAIGGHGEYVERPEELKPALERAIRSGKPACVNVRTPLRTEPANPQSGSPTETVLTLKTASGRVY